MRIYAASPGRLTRQLVADVLFVAWLVAWVMIAGAVHGAVSGLAEPGVRAERAATGLAGGLDEAGGFLGRVPLVGDGVAAPFEQAAGAAEELAAAGRAQADAVEQVAGWARLVVAALPILIVAGFYLPSRVRFARRATAGQRFIDATPDLDLFALRALANQPMHVLARVSDDPAGAWRRRDPQVCHQLAELELRDCGLRAPRGLRAA